MLHAVQNVLSSSLLSINWRSNVQNYSVTCCSLLCGYDTSYLMLREEYRCRVYENRCMSRVSSGSIVSDYGLDVRAIGVRSPARIFLIASLSRPALGPIQPPVQWVRGVLSPGLKRGRGVMLTTHPHLVPRSSMSRSYITSPPSAFMACSGTALAF
jgi:hypothetical protein